MRIRVSFSFAHFNRESRPTGHGPQTWPWWRMVSLGPVRLDVYPPSTGYRLWVYTRWGACYGDLVFDRRNLARSS